MKFFVSGTDTDVGKTLICSWLCLHSQYHYFKPIQTASETDSDRHTVCTRSGCVTHPESVLLPKPLSPHLSAKYAGQEIVSQAIQVPDADNLIIEGAGGLLVPINQNFLMIDLIQQFSVPVILVCRSSLGTINHTLLSLEAMRARNIQVAGVIVSGSPNKDNAESIAYYGNTAILAEFPYLKNINHNTLKQIPLTSSLKSILGVS